MRTYAYGHDGGNAETCGVIIIDGHKYSLSIPSATTPGDYRRYMSNRKDAGHTKPARGDMIYQYDGEPSLYVGEYALKQNENALSYIGDKKRYATAKSRDLMLSTACRLISENSSNKEHEFSLCVVTGMPVDYYRDTDTRMKVYDALDGHHTVKYNGSSYLVHVTVDRVIMEGAGALIVHGNMNKNKKYAVIDMGGHTTDLFVAEGQDPIFDQCASLDGYGVDLVGRLLNKMVEEQYRVTLTHRQRRNILRAYAQSGMSKVRDVAIPCSDGDIPDIDTMLASSLKLASTDIISQIRSTWRSQGVGESGSQFNSVLVIGGGAHFFGKDIQYMLPKAYIPDMPEEANAYGYAVLAEQNKHKYAKLA